MLHLDLRPTLSLKQGRLCRLCRQDIGEKTGVVQTLLSVSQSWDGEGVYAKCPDCMQKVPDHRNDRNYRARVRRRLRRLYESYSKEPPMSASATDINPKEEKTFVQTWLRAHERIFHI